MNKDKQNNNIAAVRKTVQGVEGLKLADDLEGQCLTDGDYQI